MMWVEVYRFIGNIYDTICMYVCILKEKVYIDFFYENIMKMPIYTYTVLYLSALHTQRWVL